MKFSSKSISRIVAILALSVAAVFSVQAQNRERGKITPEKEQMYVISARAGGVSYAEGAVQVDRISTLTRHVLAKGDEINDGDIISVGSTGNAEILLNPGSFLRLAANTDLQFANTDLEALLLKIKNGSALIEASAVGESGADIKIVTPQATISLAKSGIYRLNVSVNQTEVLVWKGAANVANQIVKGGQKIVLQKGAATTVAKFDKDESRDALDIWSKDRAKEIAKLNTKIKSRDLNRALLGFNSGFDAFGRFGGFWVLNRFTGTYCYVPYGYVNSPYGFSYYNGIYGGYYNPYGRDNSIYTPSNNNMVGPKREISAPVYNPPPTYAPVETRGGGRGEISPGAITPPTPGKNN